VTLGAPTGEGTLAPLTEAELGIWIGHQRAADAAIYNAAEGVILNGPLDAEAFEQALIDTLREASALHVRFVELAGGPRKLSAPLPRSLLKIHDLRGSFEPWSALQQQVASDLGKTFRIDEGPAFEHCLYRLEEERHVWVHRAHHVALDGYGFNLIARRVADRYGARRRGRPIAPHVFDDAGRVALEDHAYQASVERERDRQFWLRELKGLSDVALVNRARLPAQGRRASVTLTEGQTLALREVGRASSVDWTAVCLALVARTIHEGTGETAFALGVPVMLRFGSAALRTPCMAMNIVPLPVRIDLATTFSALAGQIGSTLTRARPHLRYRYEQLARDSALKIRPFGPVVNLIPFEPPRCFGECSAESIGFSAGPVEDVAFTFRPKRGTLELLVEGHREAVEVGQLSALSQLLLEGLQVVAREPTRPLLRPLVLPSVVRAAAPSLAERIEQHARLRPGALALQAFEESFTYAELHAAALRCADLLIANGAGPGKLIALEAPRGALSLLLVLAVQYAGSGYAALDAQHPPARRQRLLEQLQPDLVLQVAGAEPSLAWVGAPTLTLEPLVPEDWKQANFGAPPRKLVPPRPSDPAYLVFTSGSTGEPKGVVIGHGALTSFISAALPTYGLQSSDRVLQFASLTFDASVEELALTWAAGATLVMRDEAMLDGLPAFAAACERLALTVLDLPTALWHELCLALRAGTVTFPACVRLVIVGGEAVFAERLRDWSSQVDGVRLLNTYGPSEATIVATVADLSGHDGASPVPIGRALTGVTALVIDDAWRPVEQPGVVGELCLLGPTLAEGYLRRDDLTRQRFVPVPGFGRGYLTGDLATWDHDGQLVFSGRRDDELKISGHRIAPAEVEAALARHPQVRGSVVHGASQAGGGAYLVAHLEADAMSVDVGELRQFLARTLPAPLIPTVFELHTALPRTSHGKLDRVALRARCVATQEAASADESLAPSLRTVLDAWRDVLGGAQVAPDDDFFALGGTSLQVIQLANRLSRKGRTLSAANIFRSPTPRQQARLLEGSAAQSPIELLPVALDPSWRFQPSSPEPTMRHVLLTGATGFFGFEVLRQLLETTSSAVSVTVRGLDAQGCQSRLARVAAARGFGLERYTARLSIVALSDSAPVLTQLEHVPTCDAVINCAAEVSLTRDYRSLFASNVLFVRELIGACVRWRASLHQVSSIAAIPESGVAGPLSETFEATQAGLHDGYRLSKWQAEQLCVDAAARGLSVAVYRLGRVAASTSRAYINSRDIVWRIAAASSRLGSWPDLAIEEPWIPADTAARTLIGLMQRQSARSPARAYHLVQTGNVKLARLRAALVSEGVRLASLPLSEWVDALRQLGSDDDLATAAFFDLQGSLREQALPVQRELSWTNVAELLPDEPPTRITDRLLRAHARAALEQGLLALAGTHSPAPR